MRTLALALAVGLVVTALVPGRAAATEDAAHPANSSVLTPRTPGTPAPTAVQAGDEGLGLKQFGLATLGTVATVGLGLGLTLLTDDQESDFFGASAFLAPTVAGLVVCRVGKWSLRYEGRCGAAVVGAYLGALGGGLSGLLLGLSMCSSSNAPNPTNPESGPTSDCATTIIVGAAIGYVLGTAVGGLIGWDISRQPKASDPGNAAPVASNSGDEERQLAALERPAPAVRGAGWAPHTIVFPVLALAF